MTSSQVILYFDNPEDAVQFAVAASSVMTAEPASAQETLTQFAQKFGRVSRITIEKGESSSIHSSAA